VRSGCQALPGVLGEVAIAQLVGHAGGSQVTETVYLKQIRPVLLGGADAMDRIFTPAGPAEVVTQLVTQTLRGPFPGDGRGPLSWVGPGGLEPPTSSLSGCHCDGQGNDFTCLTCGRSQAALPGSPALTHLGTGALGPM